MTKKIVATSSYAQSKIRTSLVLMALGLVAWFSPGTGNAQTVTEFFTPSSGNAPFNIASGPDGNLWFLNQNVSGKTAIGKLSPTTGAIINYTAGITPGAGITFFTAGPDGNVWFTEGNTNKIGRITPTGTITEFSVGLSPASSPNDITLGPDGNLWFVEYAGNKVGRITPAGVITEFSVGITANAGPLHIVAGSDGALWFTESRLNKIGRIATDGTVAEFAAGISAGAGVQFIVAGADGNLWFTEYDINKIARITPAGAVTEFAAGISPNAVLSGLARGADNNLWFTEYGPNKIACITAAGAVTEFVVPTVSAGPESIAAASDGKLWFTERSTGWFGNVVPATGTIAEMQGLPVNSGLGAIAMDAAGNHWFVESNPSKLGRVSNAGAFNQFGGITAPGGIEGMAVDPSGNMWFTEYANNAIGRMITAGAGAGTVAEFKAGITPGAGPEDIAAGQDGNLWFIERSTGNIGRITPTGAVTEYTGVASPGDPAFRVTTTYSGGKLLVWFAYINSNRIGRFDPAANALTNFFVALNAGVSAMTTGPDGNVWFTEYGTGQIGRVTLAGHVDEFVVASGTGLELTGIATGPDGNLWFTEYNANKIGRITTAGVVREYSAGISPSAGVYKIAEGNDQAMWFTESKANQIGRISVPNPSPDLTITKTHAGNFHAGQTGATFTIGIRNVGSTDTVGAVTVTDTLPAGLTATAASGTGWTCSTAVSCARSDALTSGNSYEPITVTVDVAANAAASLTNTANVGGGGDTALDNNSASDTVSVDASLQIGSDVNPAVYGQTVMLTATLADATSPSGSVVFCDGGTVSGTTCSGGNVLCGGPVALTATASGGSAACAVGTLVVATHPIAAGYSGDAHNAPLVAQNVLAEVVNAAATATAVAPSSANIALGQSVVVGIAVAAIAPGKGTPTGSVVVSDGAVSCLVLLPATTCSLTPTSVGSRTLTATYTPDNGNFLASSDSAGLTVNPAPAGIVLSSSANPSSLGQPVTLTATLTSTNGNPVPTGTVNFVDGTITIANCSGVQLNAGVASCTTSTLSAGSHLLQANYAGDINTTKSSGTLQQIVNPARTSMTLTASPNPAMVGETVSLTAKVASTAPASIAAPRSAPATANSGKSAAPTAVPAASPTGSVTFYDGATQIGSGTLDANGVATSDLTSLTAGTHAISAVYAGGSTYLQATAQVTLIVNAPTAAAPMLDRWSVLFLLASCMALGCFVQGRLGRYR